MRASTFASGRMHAAELGNMVAFLLSDSLVFGVGAAFAYLSNEHNFVIVQNTAGSEYISADPRRVKGVNGKA